MKLTEAQQRILEALASQEVGLVTITLSPKEFREWLKTPEPEDHVIDPHEMLRLLANTKES